MAKVKGPLCGFDARGKLANSLVFMGWKGISTVRQHVIPANPKTDAQVAQRGFMSAAVALWHATSWNDLDVAAWDLFATVQAKVMSGFNAFMKFCVDALKVPETFLPPYAADFSGVTTTAGTITMSLASDQTTTFYWGTSKTTMLRSTLGVWGASVITFTLSANTASTTYYGYALNAAADEKGRTGIYKFTTPAS